MVKRDFRVFVEGGAAGRLATEARAAFSQLIEKAGLKGRMPRIVASGSRSDAFRDFCTAVRQAQPNDRLYLLVDSEEPVNLGPANSVWYHVKVRAGDNWDAPEGIADGRLHFLVQTMETWFLSQPDVLVEFFGQGFNVNPLPGTANIESVSKNDVLTALVNASKNCKTKAPYGKGAHSFKLLAACDPSLIESRSPYARRFFDHMRA